MKVYNLDKFVSLPDTVLFDMDNTFYDYHHAHTAALTAISEKIATSFSLPLTDVEKAYAEARNQIKEQLQKTASSHSRVLYFQRMLEILGLGSQLVHALDFEQTYWRVFISNIVLFDDLKLCLDDLRLLNIPMVLVTDLTAQIQFRKMIYLKLDQYFHFVVTSEEAGADKPHKAPFQLALQKINAKKDSIIWMIGDHPLSDIQGARTALSALTIQKKQSNGEKGSEQVKPDADFTHYRELRKFIAQLKDK